MDEPKLPTIAELERFIQDYGWNYRTVPSDEGDTLLSHYSISEDKGILVSFRIEGEFVVVSTVSFIMSAPIEDQFDYFRLNDTLKLVKLFPMSQDPLDLELGFELWQESINVETFKAFMDMLCMGIETILEMHENKELTFTTKFVSYEKGIKH